MAVMLLLSNFDLVTFSIQCYSHVCILLCLIAIMATGTLESIETTEAHNYIIYHMTQSSSVWHRNTDCRACRDIDLPGSNMSGWCGGSARGSLCCGFNTQTPFDN